MPRIGEKARLTLKAPGAAPEPPSDETIVILGHQVPKAGVVERVLADSTPASEEEIVRLVLACSLGVVVATIYLKMVGVGGVECTSDAISTTRRLSSCSRSCWKVA